MKLNKKIAQLFGYELLKRKKHPTLGSHIINLINHYSIDLVLDVGANHGQFGEKLRNEGYKGEIHSFEPVSQSFEILQKTCRKDAKWYAHKLAMGAACGKETINITEASVTSSFLDPNEFGGKEFDRINVVNQELVEVATVDSFLSGQIDDFNKRCIFLKIDTQGYDLKVLEGSLKSMDSIRCMLSEISLIPIYSGMPHYLDALRKYEEYGFVVTGFYPVVREKESLSVIEMDCTLVNSTKT